LNNQLHQPNKKRALKTEIMQTVGMNIMRAEATVEKLLKLILGEDHYRLENMKIKQETHQTISGLDFDKANL
jgi:hypothetical protein